MKIDTTLWKILGPVDISKFDFSWAPSENDPPYIYVWGNKWYDCSTDPMIEYHEPEGTSRVYMKNTVELLESDDPWKILIPGATIDRTWHPHPYDPPYIHVFGNKWNDAGTEPTIEYHVSGATDKKYVTNIVADLASTDEPWRVLIPGATIDRTWRPNPFDPPYIYVFGNKWNDSTTEPTIEYHVPGATERKYITEVIADLAETVDCWHVLIPEATIDRTWRPNPYDQQYIYVFGNKWNDATTEPTIEYHVPGATERKYITDIIATLEQSLDNWTVPNERDLTTFDFSWRPNPFAPPQVYQWENNGPIYTMSGATEVILVARDDNYNIDIAQYYITTTLDQLVSEHPTEVFWALNKDLNYDNFDFNWKPDAENFLHINSFGNELSKDSDTYYINGPAYMLGHRDVNYVENTAIRFTTDIDMFYISRNNFDTRYSELKERFPKLQKTRYLNSWVETINRCARKATTKFIWVLSSECDYSEFEFDFYPSSWQQNMVHVFGTQWSHWGNTYLINAKTFERDTHDIKIIEHLSNINHVRSRKSKLVDCLYDIIYIDHGNTSDSLQQLEQRCPDSEITVLQYQQSYASTLVKWAESLQDYEVRSEHYVWICSSVCDYESFDFTWTYDPFQNKQLHAFASRRGEALQKFGDTFLLNLSEFKSGLYALEKLEEYSGSLNYVNYLSAPRKQHPVIEHEYDSQADAIKTLEPTDWPYVELINKESAPEHNMDIVPSLWDESRSSVIVSATGASRIFAPVIAKDFISGEVYDYHDIKFVHERDKSQPLDIVFFSNGEPAAEENFARLEKIIADNQLTNRLVRVDGVQGRVASQHAAARASNTSWYFLVNCKLAVNPEFNFSWQPDRLQRPKHYIFTATNPVNGLEYGHQAIVANNRRLTLNTIVSGLDFTMDSLHQVVNKNSGVALYATDGWTCWRTAFREVIKLKYNTDMTGDYTTESRMNTWLSVGEGEYGEWSIKGAVAAIDFYDSVAGDMTELMRSYDWAWIKTYYDSIYNK